MRRPRLIVAAFVLGCGTSSDTRSVSTSAETIKPAACATGGQPAPGHVFILTSASGPDVVAGPSFSAWTEGEICGVQWRFVQTLHFLDPPCGQGTCAHPESTAVTDLLPPGRYPTVFCSACSPQSIYDVDVSAAR